MASEPHARRFPGSDRLVRCRSAAAGCTAARARLKFGSAAKALDASFASQAEPLAEVRTLEQYADWMQGLRKMMPDGRYAPKLLPPTVSATTSRPTRAFKGTHTGERDPPPTGKSTQTVTPWRATPHAPTSPGAHRQPRCVAENLSLFGPVGGGENHGLRGGSSAC